MKLIDIQHTKNPARYGQKKIVQYIRSKLNIPINRKRIQRLMRLMDIEGDYQKKRTTIACKDHKIYPYLLRNFTVMHINQVWGTDITYVPMREGYMYLTAIIDWYSRYVIDWEISNTLEKDFCIEILNRSLRKSKPAIFNTDQGSQYTSNEFTSILENNNILVSMNGKGRSLDNIYIERLWRSVKYEDIFKKSYESVQELYEGLEIYFKFYNNERIHQSLNYLTPKQIYFKSVDKKIVL